MALTSDHLAWFAQVESDDHEDIYALYTAVEGGVDIAYYRYAPQDDGSAIVSSPVVSEQLLLATPAARQALLALIAERYFSGMNSADWLGFMRAMTSEGGC